MKQFGRRGLSLLLSFVLIVGLISTSFISVSAENEVNEEITNNEGEVSENIANNDNDSDMCINDGCFHETEEGGYWINPFAEVPLSDLEYPSTGNSEIQTFANTVYGSAAAASVIADNMVARNESFSITLIDKISDWSDYFYDSVCYYSGDPQRGDSIWAETYAITYSYANVTNGYEYTFNCVYNTTAEQADELYSLSSDLLKQLGVNSLNTDYDKFEVIYEWITENVYYDYYHLELADSSDESFYRWMWSGWSAIATRGTVCQGYAHLLYYLLNMAGIGCRYEQGTADNTETTGGHAWNIVKIDGKWYYCDPTWDAGKVFYEYDWCLKGANDFVRHTPSARYTTSDFISNYPISTVDYIQYGLYSVPEDDVYYYHNPDFEVGYMTLIPSINYANDIYAYCYQDYDFNRNVYREISNPNASANDIYTYMNEQITKGNMEKLTVAVFDNDDSTTWSYDKPVPITTTGKTADKYWPNAHTSDLIKALNSLVNFVPDGEYDWDTLCQSCDVIVCPYSCTESQMRMAQYYGKEVIYFYGEDPRDCIYYNFKDTGSDITTAEAFAIMYANPSYKYFGGYPSWHYVDTGEYVRSPLCQLNTMEVDNNVVLSIHFTKVSGETCLHEYSNVEFHWAPDGLTCGFSGVCTKCGHEKTVCVDRQYIEMGGYADATCTADGWVKATATAGLNWFGTGQTGVYTSTYQGVIPTTGHGELIVKDVAIGRLYVYGIPIGDYFADSIIIGCPNCSDLDKEYSGNIFNTLLERVGYTAPTCTEPGESTFMATITIDGVTYTKSDVRYIESATGHNWNTPTFEWSTNPIGCKASTTCKNCGLYESLVCSYSSEVVIEATASHSGLRVYTARATLNGIQYTDYYTELIPQLGTNAYGTYDLNLMTCSFDVEQGIANLSVPYEDSDIIEEFSVPVNYNVKYDNDGFGIMTMSVSLELNGEIIELVSDEYSVDTETEHEWILNEQELPTCIDSGYSMYTCKTCDATKFVEYKALGHEWDEGTIIVEPSCTEEGTMLYECTREGCNEIMTETISLLGHVWDEPSFIWDDNYTECFATFVCKNCSETITVNCDVVSTETDNGIIYTATAIMDNESYIDEVTIENEVIATNPDDNNDNEDNKDNKDNNNNFDNDDVETESIVEVETAEITETGAEAEKENDNDSSNVTNDVVVTNGANSGGSNNSGMTTSNNSSSNGTNTSTTTTSNDNNSTTTESAKTGDYDVLVIGLGIIAIVTVCCSYILVKIKIKKVV